jgi:hypothetical protein
MLYRIVCSPLLWPALHQGVGGGTTLHPADPVDGADRPSSGHGRFEGFVGELAERGDAAEHDGLDVGGGF